MEKNRMQEASMARPAFDAKLKMAMALALQLEQKLIEWGKAMEANKEAVLEA